MKPETKLWHEFKRITPQITWTRLENTSVLGTPDLLGYNNNQHFFTVELKVTSLNIPKQNPSVATPNKLPFKTPTEQFHTSKTGDSRSLQNVSRY